VAPYPAENGTPWWGWLLILVAIAMLVGVVVKSMSTGG
jgi:hypothetical protein